MKEETFIRLAIALTCFVSWCDCGLVMCGA